MQYDYIFLGFLGLVLLMALGLLMVYVRDRLEKRRKIKEFNIWLKHFLKHGHKDEV